MKMKMKKNVTLQKWTKSSKTLKMLINCLKVHKVKDGKRRVLEKHFIIIKIF